ncbi:fatty acid desaturase, partial [Bacillus sp. JJ783]
SPRVPNYKLEEAHNNTLPLKNVPTITLATSLRSIRFRLWDEQSNNFVSFKDVKNLVENNVSIPVKSEL